MADGNKTPSGSSGSLGKAVRDLSMAERIELAEQAGVRVTKLVRQRLEQMPNGMIRGYLVGRSRKGRAPAMRIQCYECMGYQQAEPARCTDDGCPLFAYRPGA